jgi:hypothetical protein
MRKLLLALPLFLAIGCAQQEKAAEPTNGFGPYEGQSVYLGDEATVTVFKALDAAWAARDYTTMKDMIEDGGMFVFEDGDTVTTGQEFVDKIEADYQESLEKEVEWGWKIDYAFAAHPKGSNDPKATNQEGQWVNAQFTGNDGTYIEWYQIVEGKLKMWYQTKGDFVIPEN